MGALITYEIVQAITNEQCNRFKFSKKSFRFMCTIELSRVLSLEQKLQKRS